MPIDLNLAYRASTRFPFGIAFRAASSFFMAAFILSAVSCGFLWAPPSGSFIIPSIIRISSKSLAVILRAAAASGVLERSFQRMAAHP